jgi:hypothetical protein
VLLQSRWPSQRSGPTMFILTGASDNKLHEHK